MKKLQQRKQLSQVFIKDPNLARELVNRSSITGADTVVEVGIGKGTLTRPLSETARLVIGIEKDIRMLSTLDTQDEPSVNKGNVLYVFGDALQYLFPAEGYKVFCNPPFAIEGKLIRKLLDAVNPPTDAYLVVRKQYALRWCGVGKSTMFHCMYHPWFDLVIKHEFKRYDFTPAPMVDSVLIQITKRPITLISSAYKNEYQQFIEEVYSGQARIKYIIQSCKKKEPSNFPKNITPDFGKRPSRVTPRMWIHLFKMMHDMC